MAQRFLLTAQLRLAPPANIRAIVSQINAGLAGITANVTINTSGLNSQLNNLNRNLRNTSRAASSAANDMERFGEQAAIAIRRYGAFTLATTAFIKLTSAISSGIDEAIAFDRELVRIAQVTGHSVGGLKDLNDEVTRLSKEFGVSSTKILESSVTLAQAGLSARDVKIALEALAKTGVSATFGDIKNTTEASIAIMQQFGKEAKDLEGILGSINSVSAKFAVESEDIAVAVRRTGGAFAAAGGSLEEFQALFTSVRQTTRESAETIATGFRTIFTRIQRSRTQNFLQSLGIDLKDVEGQFVGPYEAIRRLSGALKDLKSTDPRFAQIIEELGGFRQISKVIPLITKFEVSQQALNVALRGGNSLSKDAETAQEALAVQITKVKEEFLALIRVVTNNTAFRGMIDLTLKLTSTLIKLATALEPVLPLLATFAAAKAGTSAGAFFTGFGRKIQGRSEGGPIHAFARGGLVPGQGNGDTVAANLTPGEFVIRKKAVEAIGADKLHELNKFAKGGKVYTFPYPQRKPSMYGTGATLNSELTDDEKASLKDYTGEGYIPINSSLRGKGLNHPDNKKNITNLDSAIKKSRFDKSVSYLLYRGIGKNRKDEISSQIGTNLDDKTAVGRVYTDSGYVSTSLQTSTANRFGNHLLTIKTKPGANGIDLAGGSSNALEKEVLLPRGSKFRITDTEPYYSTVQQLATGGFVYNKDAQRFQYGDALLSNKEFAKVIGFSGAVPSALNKDPRVVSLKSGGTLAISDSQKSIINTILGKKPAAKTAAAEIAKADAVIRLSNVPNLITGDPTVTGQSYTEPLGNGKGIKLQTLINEAKSQSASSLLSSKFKNPDTVFTGAMNIHGLRPDVGESFDSNVNAALSKAAQEIVNASPIHPKPEQRRNINDLISKSAIQSIKGQMLEAMSRIITGQSLEHGTVDAKIDFPSSANLNKVFNGNIAGPSEAKINASTRSKNSVVLKGLTSGITSGIKGQGIPQLFANGGHAIGTDTVPAMLTPGEFVLNKRAAASLGSATLHKLNNADKVQKYAAGGHVQKFALGGSPSSLGNTFGNPFAIAGIVTTISSLSQNFVKADTELGKLISTISNVVFQFGIFKSVLDGIKSSIPTSLLTATPGAGTDAVAKARQLEARGLSRRNAIDTAVTRVKFNKILGAASLFAGIGAQVGGAALSEQGQKEIANGNKAGISKSRQGDIISGAGIGAAIGSIFGPLGTATGALIGGFLSLYNTTGKYEKQLEGIKFAKKMDEFSRVVDRFSSGKLSLRESRGAIISGVSDIRKQAVGTNAQDIKAKFGTDSGKIEKFIDDIAKESKSFEELEKSTGDLINHFSILTDLPYSTLKTQLEKQIEAYQKSSLAVTKIDKLIEEETRATIVLAAMNTAINNVNSTFDTFDSSLANSAGFLSGRGASFQPKDFTAILEKVGTGKFNDVNTLRNLGGQTLSAFGGAGSTEVDKLAETSKVLSELPSILLAVKNQDPLGTQGNFTDRLERLLKERGFSDTVAKNVSGGADKFIGAEDKDEKIINAIKDNLSAVVAEVGKSLQTTVDTFKEFAPAFKNQVERIRAAFDIYTQSQVKVAEFSQTIAKNSEAAINFRADATNTTRSSSDVRSAELNRIGLLTGGITDTGVLGARLKSAQQRATDITQKASETLDVTEQTKLNNELAKANIEINNTTKALEELANSSEGLNAIQKELALEEEKRKFKENLTLTAIFGSREAKQDLDKKIGFTSIAATRGLDFVPEQEREGILQFLQSAGKQKIGGVEADELLKRIAENSFAGQRIGSGFVRDNLTQGGGPNAQALIGRAEELIKAQSDALNALSGNAENIGKLAAVAIAEQNDKFLGQLRKIFIDRLIGDKEQAISGKSNELAIVEAKKITANKLSGRTGIEITDANIKDVQPAVDTLKNIKNTVLELQRLNSINKEGVGFKLDFKDDNLGNILTNIKDKANKSGIELNDTDLERISNIIVKDKTIKGNGFGFGSPAESLKDKLTDNDKAPLSKKEIERFNKALQEIIIEKNADKINTSAATFNNLKRELSIGGTEVGRSIAKEITNVGLTDIKTLEKAIRDFETDIKSLGNDSIDKLTESIRILENQINILNNGKSDLIKAKANTSLPIPVEKATGGHIPGVGTGDTVPAMLTPGEFVMRKSAVEAIGLSNLYAMNNGYNVGGVVQRFADGGRVETVAQKRKRLNDGITASIERFQRRQAALEKLAAAKSEIRAKSAEKFANVQSTRGREKDTEFFKNLNKQADSLIGPKPITGLSNVNTTRDSIIGNKGVLGTHNTIQNSKSAERERFLREELRQGMTRDGNVTFGEGRKDQLFAYRQELGKIIKDRSIGKTLPETTVMKDRGPRKTPIKAPKFEGEYKSTPRIDRLEAIRADNQDGIGKNQRARNRNAFRSRGGFGQQRFADGGQVSGGGNVNIQGITELRSVVETFSTVVDNMTKKLESFKDLSISLSATHKVEVVFNGAEILSKLHPEIERIAVEQTKVAINKMIDDKFPDVGRV